MTVSEFAEAIKHDYQTTAAFVKVLQGIGAAREIGKRPQPSGRGKPSTVYSFDNEIDLVIWPELVENLVDSVDTDEKLVDSSVIKD